MLQEGSWRGSSSPVAEAEEFPLLSTAIVFHHCIASEQLIVSVWRWLHCMSCLLLLSTPVCQEKTPPRDPQLHRVLEAHEVTGSN